MPRAPAAAGRGAGLGKAPAQLDVLARLEGRVEAVLEQDLAVEDRRHQPEPVPAATGPMVLGERLSPVAGTGLAEQSRLECRVAVALELGQHAGQRPVG